MPSANPALEYNKNNFGRPLKFTTPRDLQEAIDTYFNSCLTPALNEDGSCQTDKNGNVIYEQIKPYTITGLAVALDTNRQTLLTYAERADFSDIIARAKEKCENYAEMSLFDRNKARGAEFVLNTSYKGWVPKREVESTTPVNLLQINNNDIKALTIGDLPKLTEMLEMLQGAVSNPQQIEAKKE